MQWLQTDIGSQISTQIPLISVAATAEVDSAPVATESSWADNNSPGHDFRFLSGQLTVACLAPSGAPSSFSVAGKLQTSADGATNWTDIPGAAITPITTAGKASVNAQFGGSFGFVRAVVVPSFVGGSSPAITLVATIVLGGNQSH